MLNVIHTKYIKDFKIFVEYDNNVKKEIDFSEYLKHETRPIFNYMKVPENFRLFKITNNTVCWNDVIDIAPEFLLEM